LFDEAIGNGHSFDLGELVKPLDPIQGIVFTKACSVHIDGEQYGVLRCVGITRTEMEFKRNHGADVLLARLRNAGIYPRAVLDRNSVVGSSK
jgi:hypothetical protein